MKQHNKLFKLCTACTFNSFHSVVKQYLKKHWMVCAALHLNIFASLTDHFANPFVRKNVAPIFDIVVNMPFESLTLMPFEWRYSV